MRALRQAVHGTFSGFPATFWWLELGTLINRVGGFVVTFLSLYLTSERGLSVAEAGVVVSLYGAGTIPAGLVGGALSDHLGRRATLLLALVTSAGAMLALGFMREPGPIAVAAFLLGLTGDLYRPAVSATIADLIPASERMRAYALHHWTVNLGFCIAPVIAGFMAHRSFLALFIADAATTLAYAVLVWFKVPETRAPRTAEEASQRTRLSDILIALRDRTFVPFFVLSFCLAVVFLQGFVTLPLDMKAHGIDPSTFGMVIAVNGILIVFLQPFVGAWVRGFRRSRVLAVACVLVGTGYGLTGLVGTPGLYAATIGIWTLGEIASAPTAQALVADIAPAHARGRYQGAYSMTWGLGFFAAPLVGSVMLEKLGSRWLWGSCLVLASFVSVGHLLIADARRRRLAELRPELAASGAD